MMINQITGPVVRPIAWFLEKDDMRVLGLGTTMRWATTYNRWSYGSHQQRRERLYREQFTSLINENGAPERAPVQMKDGWAIDRSGSLPHLSQLLQDTAAIIEERGGQPAEDYGKPFLRPIQRASDLERYPSILNFITSSTVLTTVAEYCGFVPLLSPSMPPGVRLMESTTKFDKQPDGPWRSSQLWHLDYHSAPTIYVVVALRDITPECGPFVFLSRSVSEKAAAALRYRAKGSPYRVKDEAIEAVIDGSEIQRFCAPAGSVLFIDSNRCFHYGSRRPVIPRYHLQYAFVATCRTDFSDIRRPQVMYKTSDRDSRLRRMVLDRHCAD
jgi:hypothetical protein